MVIKAFLALEFKAIFMTQAFLAFKLKFITLVFLTFKIIKSINIIKMSIHKLFMVDRKRRRDKNAHRLTKPYMMVYFLKNVLCALITILQNKISHLHLIVPLVEYYSFSWRE